MLNHHRLRISIEKRLFEDRLSVLVQNRAYETCIRYEQLCQEPEGHVLATELFETRLQSFSNSQW